MALVFRRTELRLKILLWVISHIMPDIEYILSNLKNSHNLMVESYVLFGGNF